MFKKTIVIFAKSIKKGGHCVAGKDTNSNEWVRIVSSSEGDELSKEQTKCTNSIWKNKGKQPYQSKCLQKIEIEFLNHAPLPNQPDNFVSSNNIWEQNFKIEKNQLINYLDRPESLWGDGDRVCFYDIQNNNVKILQSLYLVKVCQLNMYKNNFYKRRASFLYQGIYYDLPVTDPNFDSIIHEDLLSLQNILCISLGENFDGVCYKIIAAIY